VALAGTLPFAILAVVLMRLVLRSRQWKSARERNNWSERKGVVVKLLQSGAEGMIRVHASCGGRSLPARAGRQDRPDRCKLKG